MGISARPYPGVVVRTGAERATLVRRTYSLVFASILVTIAGAAFAMSQPAIMQSVARHPFITMIGMFAPLMLALKFREAFPANLGLVFLFTFVEGLAISPILYVYGRNSPGVIGQAGMLTASAFGVLTLYAFVSRRDFSAMGAFFTVGLWVLIATSLLNLFFQNQTASLWLAGATVLVFSGLLVFDTWRLRNVFGPEDYVQAAVTIYLDLLNMFLAILSLLGGRRE
ncbi:MAG: Bax inhibitor-1/YccA family protein [Gemmatimonadetes bacterium]|jgi:FtsH-binding integral membrane protein|nr:Bax inhibitor-1/YccA family protein [Gemmatimonadota bacterium]HNV74569.1 Bax inhibitor-1/YccA family protein [Gemmatimonadaceae bacterium]MBK6454648.1 Bax inhibitor-1/YccA family protein [Gemmatimonadota bacterium]MBK6840852.1 Bax inhibitor-1/YccA family protein [Gemmatimonadota bacterium]MBK7834530.1 Bax inhibitor-1/YccA family protein [Gemmatimonadota bacterium]